MSVFRWNSLQDLVRDPGEDESSLRGDDPPDRVSRTRAWTTALWSPAADVYETPEEIILQVELPGVRLDDVHLEALDGKLRVSGHRRADADVEPRHFVRMERIYGNFSREFPFPLPRPLADQGDA